MSSTSRDTMGSWAVTTPPTREADNNHLAPLVFRYRFTAVPPPSPPNNSFSILAMRERTHLYASKTSGVGSRVTGEKSFL